MCDVAWGLWSVQSGTWPKVSGKTPQPLQIGSTVYRSKAVALVCLREPSEVLRGFRTSGKAPAGMEMQGAKDPTLPRQ